MVFYYTLFGKNKNSNEILASIGLSESDFYRFRDCYISEDNEIVVFTRGGGNNRECNSDDCDYDEGVHVDTCAVYIQENNRKHPLYLRDEDNDFDSTYATFYFRNPETLDIKKYDTEIDLDELWQLFLSALENKTTKF